MRLEPKWQRKLAMQMHSGGTHVGGALDTMTLSHVLLLDGAMLMLMVLVMIMVAMKVTMSAIKVSCDNPGSLSSEYMRTQIR